MNVIFLLSCILLSFLSMFYLYNKKIRGHFLIKLIIIYSLFPIIIQCAFLIQFVIILIIFYLIATPIIIIFFGKYYNSKKRIERIFIKTVIFLPIVLTLLELVFSEIFNISISINENGIIYTSISSIILNLVANIIWDIIINGKKR
jgi:hypothetical protein